MGARGGAGRPCSIATETRAVRDEAGGADPDGPLTWTLTWRDGQIVAGDSGIEATATGATEQVTIDTEAEMAGVAET